MFTLTNIPYWYIALAVVVSIYQAYRGYKIQLLLGVGRGEWSCCDRALVLCIADTFTYLLCSLSGFYSLLLFYRAANATETAGGIGHPAFLIFLMLYGVLGVTGKLPDALNKLQLK